jgi:hypothetical protein
MKTMFEIKCLNSGVLLKLLFVVLLTASCQDDPEIIPLTECFSQDIQKPYSSEGPHYNLNVYFTGSKATMCGYVEFRQHTDNAKFIQLDTWIHGLEPNTNYLLQRAVDTTIDGNCTSTDWLTLGKGMTPQSIMTDGNGDGYAELYRSVAALAVGATFDIHFQILKESDDAVVLSSDCYEYAVR